MKQLRNENLFKSVITFLGIPPKSITDVKCKDEGLFIHNVMTLLRKDTQSPSIDDLHEAILKQHLEYAVTHLKSLPEYSSVDISNILKDLNEFLSTRVYITGNEKNVIDLLFYQMLHFVIKNLSFCDREKYINLVRWFKLVQEDNRIRQSYPRLLFSKTLLYV